MILTSSYISACAGTSAPLRLSAMVAIQSRNLASFKYLEEETRTELSVATCWTPRKR